MHDVAIIGGGPAGSTAAAILAGKGHDVVVLERERFPRLHIGESLLPGNMRIFDRLGVTDRLQARFIEKWGVTFLSSTGTLKTDLKFDAALGSRYPKCFEVKRAEFDQLLLENAELKGASVRQGVRATRAGLEADGGWELALENEHGAPERLRARYLIDASGQEGFLARQWRLRDREPLHRRAALFAHYEGIPRSPGREAGNIVIITLHRSWFWVIPFSDGTTSVGVVADGAKLRSVGLPPEKALPLALECCPSARNLTANASRITPVGSASDWTYSSRRIAGPGSVMVGDAAAFVDPVFSSGVLLAMSSAESAADLVASSLRSGRHAPITWTTYEKKVMKHVAAYRRMVDLFYTPAFPQLCFFPSDRLGLIGAVLSLLSGNLDPSPAVRWRLELFYLIGSAFNRFNLGPRIQLHEPFEQRTITLGRGSARS